MPHLSAPPAAPGAAPAGDDDGGAAAAPRFAAALPAGDHLPACPCWGSAAAGAIPLRQAARTGKPRRLPRRDAALPPAAAAGAEKPYRGALRGPRMVDGTESGKSEYLERLDAEARARLTPEDWERAARLNSMPLEELYEIGRKADEERRWKERFAEIP